jgi:hypothetical protein
LIFCGVLSNGALTVLANSEIESEVLELKKVAVVVAFVVLFALAMREIQYDKRQATVTEIKGNIVEFEISTGICYEWEVEKGEKPYKVGEKVTLKMFDYEDSNPYNDTIVKIERR